MRCHPLSSLLLGAAIALASCGGGGGNGGDDDGSGDGDGGGTNGDGGGGDDDGGTATPVGEHVFDPDVLHEVSITVAPGDLATLDSNQDVRVRCTITIDGETVAEAGCKKKGTTSVRPLSGKTGFTVKMNEFVSGQKLDGLKKLTIDNAIQDPSLLVGHLSYEVYRRAGLPAPRTAHATLSFNGVDKGLFVLEESTNGQYLEGLYGDGNGDGNLYEGPWDFPKGVAAADLKDEVSEMRTRDDLEALTRVVMDSTDAQLSAALEAQLDVDRFITNFAVEEVAVLWDNYAVVAWNYYLYHVPGGRFVILTHGVNWPYWVASFDPFDLNQDPWGTDDPPGYLCVRLLRIPAYAAAYRAELTRVARDAWDVDILLARIDRATATLHSRPLTGASLENLGRHEAELTTVRDFVRDRRTYLANLLGF
jgi:spore coat protein H